jgi:hypothetical protein
MTVKRIAVIKRRCIQLFLNEFIWRRRNCNGRTGAFNKILEVIRAEFPVELVDENDNEDFQFSKEELEIDEDEFESFNPGDDSTIEILTESETENDRVFRAKSLN